MLVLLFVVTALAKRLVKLINHHKIPRSGGDKGAGDKILAEISPTNAHHAHCGESESIERGLQAI